MANTISVLFESVPKALDKVKTFVELHATDYPILKQYGESLNLDFDSIIKNIMTVGSNIATGFVNSSITVASTFTGQIINFVIGFIFALYILSNKEKLQYQINRLMEAYLKPKYVEKIRYVLGVANDSFSSFITGQCIEAVILGSLCALGMMIFCFPYAGMIGTFIGATALIPVVGAYLGAILGVIMIVTVSPIKALLFIVYIVILQQLENNLIYPKVVGSSIGLPGMWVLAAVTIGGGLGGVVGMMFGVPTAATVYKLTKYDVNQRLLKSSNNHKKKEAQEKTEDNNICNKK